MDLKVEWGIAWRRQRSKVQHKAKSARGDHFIPVALNQLLGKCAVAILLLIAEYVSESLLKHRLTL